MKPLYDMSQSELVAYGVEELGLEVDVDESGRLQTAELRRFINAIVDADLETDVDVDARADRAKNDPEQGDFMTGLIGGD